MAKQVKQKYINKTSLIYKLKLKNGEYTISCIHIDSQKRVLDRCEINSITPSKQHAIKLFNKIVKGRVSPCTLCDVISDLIC